MFALKRNSKALVLSIFAAVLLCSAVTQAHAETEGHEVMVTIKNLFAIKVALGLYHADHSTYPTGTYTSYDELAHLLKDRYGIPYMELSQEWKDGTSFDFVNYSGDRESYVINVRVVDVKGTIVSATPDRVIIR
jgi:hypothetical protein